MRAAFSKEKGAFSKDEKGTFLIFAKPCGPRASSALPGFYVRVLNLHFLQGASEETQTNFIGDSRGFNSI